MSENGIAVAFSTASANAPNPLPSGFYLFVEDCDAVYHRAIQAGATSLWPPADQQYGERTAGFVDPFGYQWIPATQLKRI